MRRVGPILTIVAALPCAAQEVFGRSIVEGRPVELLSDRTWRDTGAPADGGCDALPQGITFCGAAEGWRAVPPPTPFVSAAYSRDSRSFGQLVIEDIGSDAGVDLDGYTQAILAYAASAQGLAPAALVILDSADATLGMDKGRTVAFEGKAFGLPITFMVTIVMRPGWTVQVSTWEIGPGFDESDRALHERFSSLVELPP